MRDPWIVSIKGGVRCGYEISVLRTSNKHGRKSYGWFDETKICIASIDSFQIDKDKGNKDIVHDIFNYTISLAHRVCLQLNSK